MLALVGHATTPDKLKVNIGTAGDLDTSVHYADINQGTLPAASVEDIEREDHTFTGTGLNDIVAGITTATKRRNIKQVSIVNTHVSVTTTVAVILDAIDGNDYQVYPTVTLAPGEGLMYDEGLGWFKTTAASLAVAGSTNLLTGADQALGTSDVYLNNSALSVAALGPVTIGRCYHWRFIVSKTAAGTATPIIIVRTGTAGTTADTARLTFTWGAGTAAIDRGEVELEAMVVAAGASAVLRGKANWTTNLATTGLTNAVKSLQPADSGTFDISVANLLIGLSYNAGATGAHTLEYMGAYTDQF